MIRTQIKADPKTTNLEWGNKVTWRWNKDTWLHPMKTSLNCKKKKPSHKLGSPHSTQCQAPPPIIAPPEATWPRSGAYPSDAGAFLALLCFASSAATRSLFGVKAACLFLAYLTHRGGQTAGKGRGIPTSFDVITQRRTSCLLGTPTPRRGGGESLAPIDGGWMEGA